MDAVRINTSEGADDDENANERWDTVQRNVGNAGVVREIVVIQGVYVTRPSEISLLISAFVGIPTIWTPNHTSTTKRL
jgi:hypothetical protein